MKGLFKGVTASQIREGSYSTLRLGLYEPFKELLGATDPANTPLWLKLLAGGMSGFVSSALATPTDICKVRMQAWEGEPKSFAWHFRTIYKHWGFTGLYKGIGPTITRAVLVNATNLATYDHIKHFFLNHKILSEGWVLHFASSMAAGLCMAIFTAPVDTIKTRVMNQPTNQKLYTSMLDCAMKIVRKEGPFALYNGFIPNWISLGSFVIFSMMIWE